MAIHAQAVEILVTKGRFDPKVALGIAEAIEVSMTAAQLVTVPILDARIQELKAENRTALSALETKLNASIQGLRADFTGELHSVRAELLTEIHKVKAELVRWVFLTMLGNVALSLGASAIAQALKNFG